MSKEIKKTVEPRLRFPEFKKSEFWMVCSINYLIGSDILYPPQDGNHGEIHPKSDDYVQDGIPFVMANNVRNGSVNFTNCNHISRKQADGLRKGFSKEGDVLLTHKGTVGEVAIVKRSKFPFIMLTPQVTYYRVKNKKKLSNVFLATAFISPDYKKNLLVVSGGGTRAYVGITEQCKLKISLPVDIKEQQKIADCLSSLDDLITAKNDKVDVLENYKKGLLQQLFPQDGETVPRLRFPEFNKFEEWEGKTLKDVCKMQAGKFVSASEIIPDLSEGLFPCYGGNGLRGYTKTYTHCGEYSLIGRQGALCGNITFARGKFHATEHAVVVTPIQAVSDTNWLYHALMFLNLNQYATGQAQPGLSVENLNNVKIIVPSKIEEQQKIADCLSSLDQLIAVETEKVVQLKAHKKGLLQQLFPTQVEEE